MIRRMMAAVLVMCLVFPELAFARYQPKPHWPNFFSTDQDVELGKQYAAEVPKEMPLVTDAEVNSYVEKLGLKLATKAPLAKYPYTFKVVNQKEINAFALPGGPIFVNLGTIQAADNESQLAGVMAHEISHVVMRHATNQASKQMLAQMPLAFLGGRLGSGMLGQLAQMGIGFGIGSVFLKYSRDAEREADLVGTDILYDSGYNPQGMAVFFKKLEEQSAGGKAGSDFFNSHPNPGNRAQAVTKEIATLEKRQAAPMDDSADFRVIKKKVMTMKAMTAEEIAALQKKPGTGGTPISRTADMMPSGEFKSFEHSAYTVSYPANWDVFGDKNSAVTIAPKNGVTENAVAYGTIISGFEPESRTNTSLDTATHELLTQMKQSNAELRQVGNDEDFRLNGVAAKSVVLLGPSPLLDKDKKPEQERDWLVVTKAKDGSVIYFVFISPDQDFKTLYPTFDKMLRSVKMK